MQEVRVPGRGPGMKWACLGVSRARGAFWKWFSGNGDIPAVDGEAPVSKVGGNCGCRRTMSKDDGGHWEGERKLMGFLGLSKGSSRAKTTQTNT